MSLNPYVSLTFGNLDLLGRVKTGAYWFEAFAEADWGEPESVVRAIESFLMDGAIEATESNSNRTMVLKVAVVAPHSAGLAAGEAALMSEVAKRNILTYVPADSSSAGEPCVFDVVNSSLSHGFDDLADLRVSGAGNGERVYTLTIKALPWARSDELSTLVSAPPPATPTTAVVDACTATTGWSSTRVLNGSSSAATVSTSGGAVLTTLTNNGSSTTTLLGTLTRTGLSAVVTSTPYIRIDYTIGYSGSAPLTSTPTEVLLNGVVVPEKARVGNVAWYQAPASPLTSVAVRKQIATLVGGAMTITINDITRSDAAADVINLRQTYRALAVSGSVRTPANLTLTDPTVALGSVLVYTTPNTGSLMQPSLRPLRTSGSAETTDTTLTSSKSSDLSTLHTFDIPANNVPPAGYVLMARVKHATAASYPITWAARGRVGSTNDTGQSGVQSVTLAAATWTIVPVAKLTLPTREMGSAGLVRIELSGPAGLLLDEAWLFNTDDGDLTWVECGSAAPSAGGSANRVWIDAASLDSPVPSISVGTATDRSDAFGAGASIGAWGAHKFVPPSMNVFTVTSNSVATTVTLSYYPSFHSHVV